MRILDDIDELGVPRINLTGGEALLRKDIFDLISYASDKFVVILESNGLLLSPETALRLKRAKISCVAVSVDTTNGAEHDSLRGVKECFNSAMEGIRNLRRAGVPCIMSTYIPVEKANIRYIQDFMALAKANRVLAVRILPPRPVGSFSCNTSSLLDKKAENLIRNSADPFIAYFNGMPAPSMCGIFTRSTFYISPYGEVQPCPYMPLSFGNIKNADLPELLKLMWNNDIFNDFGKKCLVLNTKFRETYLDNLREYPAEVRGKQK
jgi:MoaA/NifB/PqqE/SkfB family radical SAM enzyme